MWDILVGLFFAGFGVLVVLSIWACYSRLTIISHSMDRICAVLEGLIGRGEINLKMAPGTEDTLKILKQLMDMEED